MISALVIATEVLVIAAAIGVIGWVVLILAVACHWAWVTLRDSWRRARGVIEQTEAEFPADEPVPYWPADPEPDDLEALVTATSCGRCRDLGYGICWCRTNCGHAFCWGEPALCWRPEDDDVIEGRRPL